MPFLRTALASLLSLLTGMVGLCVLAIVVFGWGWLRQPVETRASAALDRPVSIAGLFTVTWEWDLSPRLHTSAIRVGPAAVLATLEADPPANSACQTTIDLAVGD
jgi:uncharacterized protein involved in outer membrane biogenesis